MFNFGISIKIIFCEEFGMKYYRPYHLVDPSPWPFVGGLGFFFFYSIGGGNIFSL